QACRRGAASRRAHLRLAGAREHRPRRRGDVRPVPSGEAPGDRSRAGPARPGRHEVKALLALLLATAAPGSADTVAITGGTVAGTLSEAPIEGGTVVITGGRITAVGRNVAVPAGATIIDATGKWVTPG